MYLKVLKVNVIDGKWWRLTSLFFCENSGIKYTKIMFRWGINIELLILKLYAILLK